MIGVRRSWLSARAFGLAVELTAEAFGHGVEGGRCAAHVVGAANGCGDIGLTGA